MSIPPVTEFEGQLPAENDPATFPARAEALFDWLVGQGMPTFNAAIAAVNVALNDNGTVLDTAGTAIALTTNANTIRDTAGTGNAYTITPAVAVAAYADGQTFMLRPNRQNTGAVTLAVGSLGSIPVRKIAAAGSGFVELASGDWRIGEIHIVTFRGGQFELLTVPLSGFVRTDQNLVINGAWTFNGALAFGMPSQVRTALGLLALATRSTVGTAQIDDGAVTTAKLDGSERLNITTIQNNLAGMQPGAVGTFVFAQCDQDVLFGATVAGSQLQPAAAWFQVTLGGGGGQIAMSGGAPLTGAWRCLGRANTARNVPGAATVLTATLFVRVA